MVGRVRMDSVVVVVVVVGLHLHALHHHVTVLWAG